MRTTFSQWVGLVMISGGLVWANVAQAGNKGNGSHSMQHSVSKNFSQVFSNQGSSNNNSNNNFKKSFTPRTITSLNSNTFNQPNSNSNKTLKFAPHSNTLLQGIQQQNKNFKPVIKNLNNNLLGGQIHTLPGKFPSGKSPVIKFPGGMGPIFDPGKGNGNGNGGGNGNGQCYKNGCWNWGWNYGCSPWYGYSYCKPYCGYYGNYGYPYGGTTVVQVPVQVPVATPVVAASATTLEATTNVDAKLPQVIVGSKLTIRDAAIPATEGLMMLQVGQLVFPMEINKWEAGAVSFTVPMLLLTAPTKADLVAVDKAGQTIAGQAVQLVAPEKTATAPSGTTLSAQ